MWGLILSCNYNDNGFKPQPSNMLAVSLTNGHKLGANLLWPVRLWSRSRFPNKIIVTDTFSRTRPDELKWLRRVISRNWLLAFAFFGSVQTRSCKGNENVPVLLFSIKYFIQVLEFKNVYHILLQFRNQNCTA
ncbi:hypothetical protein CEXT_147071 [Caerostris extrusa]|uniref:Uncharacterized protein n=1 Tax=Caerostris extrusa TaxID=172846 RepID=A0AAV4TS54_CAEEX|nr:hypothetical protein CEXT_147071 [Caerostris extrusa]